MLASSNYLLIILCGDDVWGSRSEHACAHTDQRRTEYTQTHSCARTHTHFYTLTLTPNRARTHQRERETCWHTPAHIQTRTHILAYTTNADTTLWSGEQAGGRAGWVGGLAWARAGALVTAWVGAAAVAVGRARPPSGAVGRGLAPSCAVGCGRA